ncbi:MAG: sulfurtransferase complex subunit TusB [Gammaproteobacteria bacterium]
MAMLHTINKSPFERNSLDACLRLAKPGSAVLLIEDGIYAATKGTAVSDKVTKAMEGIKFFVLGPDVKARGISDDHMLEGVQVVDYGGFVDLVAEHDNVQSWL